MSLGVVIGRFQIDELTEAHIKLLRVASKYNQRLLVLIGTRPSPLSRKYPLPYAAVEMMIRKEFTNATVVPLQDARDDESWQRNLENVIGMIACGQPVTIYHGRDSFRSHYTGRYKTVDLNFDCNEIAASNQREQIAAEIDDSPEWRKGVIWATYNRPPVTYHAVDAALLRYNTKGTLQLLMGKRSNEMKWRFPGGFRELGERAVVAAGRELHEETGLYSLDGFRIVNEFVVNDWRTRGVDGVATMTTLCYGWYSTGEPKPSDDLDGETEFHNVVNLYGSQDKLVVEEHLEMLNDLVMFLNASGVYLTRN